MQNYLCTTAQKLPDKTAVVANNQEYTFNDIDIQSTSLAASLQALGVERGDRVVMCLGNTIESVIGFWAILKAGAVISPLNIDIQPEKLEYILQDAGAKVLLISDNYPQNDWTALFQNARSLQAVLVQGAPAEKEFPDSIHRLEEARQYPTEKLKANNLIDIDLAMIIYTSGSTGNPKGVMHTHRSMITATESLNAYLQYKEEDIVMCVLPVSFDYGLYQMIMSISVGATLILEKDLTWPIFFLKKIAQYKATILPAVPTMVSLLATQNKKLKIDVSSVRVVSNTGAALTEGHISQIKETFTSAEIFSMYGLTECKRCSYLPPQDIDRKPGSVGIAIPNTELWLVDDEGNRLGTNQVGQLVIRGGTVMKGYWNKPEKTAEKLRDGLLPNERVLYTGDYCMLDEEGYLYFKGRMDQVIKSRGMKVSPKEIEDFLHKIDGIQDAVTLGVPHPEAGEVIYAYITLHPNINLSAIEVKEKCKQEMEKFKVPEYIAVLPSIPKTPNGKFNTQLLKQQAVENVEEAIAA